MVSRARSELQKYQKTKGRNDRGQGGIRSPLCISASSEIWLPCVPSLPLMDGLVDAVDRMQKFCLAAAGFPIFCCHPTRHLAVKRRGIADRSPALLNKEAVDIQE